MLFAAPKYLSEAKSWSNELDSKLEQSFKLKFDIFPLDLCRNVEFEFGAVCKPGFKLIVFSCSFKFSVWYPKSSILRQTNLKTSRKIYSNYKLGTLSEFSSKKPIPIVHLSADLKTL